MPKQLPSGSLVIDGVTYQYRDGILRALGITMLISSDGDFVVDSNHTPMGAIIGGELVPMQKLDTKSLKFLKNKYGF